MSEVATDWSTALCCGKKGMKEEAEMLHINISRFLVMLFTLFIIFNIALYEMQYSTSASIILRFLPSWLHVELIGNAVFMSILGIACILKKRNKKISNIGLFIIVLMCFNLVTIFAAALTQGEAIRSMLVPDKTDMFMDFFNSIQYGFEPYAHLVIYPPLINLFYAFCGSMMPLNDTVLSHAVYIRDLQMAWIVLYGVTMLTILGISVIIWHFLEKEKKINRVLFLIAVYLSLPVVFAIERGNSLLYTLLFLLIFIYWYKSEKAVWRYLSYVSLGIAVGIKIAPIVFGLLILRSRKWKETGITVVIVALIFYVPFFFLDGDISKLISNLQYNISLAQSSRINSLGTIQMLGNGVYVNLWNSLDFIGRILNMNFWNVSKVLSVLLMFLSVGITLFVNCVEEWKLVALLCLILILLPGYSAVYCLCYMLLPILILFRDNYGKCANINYVYIALVLCMFVPIVNFRFSFLLPFADDAYLMRISTIIESAALLIMVAILLWDILRGAENTRSKKITVVSVAAVAIYSFILLIIPKPVYSFVPGDMSVVNASKGLVLEYGRYNGIEPDGRLLLQTESLKEYGLIVAASKSNAEETVQLYLDGKMVASQRVSGTNWYIYLSSQEIQALNLSDTVEIGLAYEGKDVPVPLTYAGKPRLTDLVYSGTFMDDISEGFWRKTGEADLRMGEYAHVLLAGEIAEKGLLVKYYVPEKMLVNNPGKMVELEFSVDGRKIKSVPVKEAGEQTLVLLAADICKAEDFPYVLDLGIKSNAVYRESDDGESLDTREQSIQLVSIGNVEAEPDIWSHWLTGCEKVYLSAEELKENGFSLIYKLNPANQKLLGNTDLQLEIVMDGQIVAQKELAGDKVSCLGGVFIPAEKFASHDAIVCTEIRVVQAGAVPWGLLYEKPELVKMLYVGANKINNDYTMPNEYLAQIAMSGITQDSKDKQMYLSQSGEVIFLQRDMLGHDMVVDYDVPLYLLGDIAPILTVKVHDKIIRQERLDVSGQAELRIPAEQLRTVLGEDGNAVIPVRLIMNKTFNRTTSHIFGIDKGEKSIILRRVYLD